VLRLDGDLAGAETLLRQSLAINLKTRGAGHPNTATNRHDLALITASRGDYATADAELRQVADLQKKALGERHPVVATTLNSLAHVRLAEQQYDGADAALQEALRIARAAFGPGHQLVAIYSLNLAAVALARHDPAAAAALLRTGIGIREHGSGLVPVRRRTLPADDWSVGGARSLLGATLTTLGRYGEAEGALLQARRELEAQTVVSPADVHETVRRLAALYTAWGKPHDAAAYRALLHD